MTNNNQVAPNQNSLKQILNSPTVQNQLSSILKDRSSQFASSLITLASNDPQLRDAEPMSIVSGAMQAAQLSLPLEKQFGFVYLIPFNTKENGSWIKKAQFILGYRGYIQLAQRSGQYRSINVGNVYDGQLESWDPFKEKLEFNPHGKNSDEVIGYFGYFQLTNGFEKTTYWTKEQIEQHRVQNNKSKNKQQLSGVWKTNYDAMAQKTVLRSMLSKWGILSVEMQQAILADEEPEYEDTETQVRRDVSENANKELIDFDKPKPEPTPANLTDENIKKSEEQSALFGDLSSVADNNLNDLDPGY